MMLASVDIDEIAAMDAETLVEGQPPEIVWRHHRTVGPFDVHTFGWRDGHYAVYVTSGHSKALRLRGSVPASGIDRGKAFLNLIESPADADILADFVLPGVE